MRPVAGVVLVIGLCGSPVLAQERDRSLERISIALQQPLPVVSETIALDPPNRRHTRGIFTLVPPETRGEVVRVSVPIGELVSQAFENLAAARQRRQEAAARRKVDTALKAFLEQHLPPER